MSINKDQEYYQLSTIRTKLRTLKDEISSFYDLVDDYNTFPNQAKAENIKSVSTHCLEIVGKLMIHGNDIKMDMKSSHPVGLYSDYEINNVTDIFKEILLRIDESSLVRKRFDSLGMGMVGNLPEVDSSLEDLIENNECETEDDKNPITFLTNTDIENLKKIFKEHDIKVQTPKAKHITEELIRLLELNDYKSIINDENIFWTHFCSIYKQHYDYSQHANKENHFTTTLPEKIKNDIFPYYDVHKDTYSIVSFIRMKLASIHNKGTMIYKNKCGGLVEKLYDADSGKELSAFHCEAYVLPYIKILINSVGFDYSSTYQKEPDGSFTKPGSDGNYSLRIEISKIL